MADGGFSDAQEKLILENFFMQGANPAKTTTYLALCQAPPADNSDVISEVSYSGYVRQPMSPAAWNFDDTTLSADPSYVKNNSQITFPECVVAPDPSQTATNWALMSAQSVGTGLMLFSGTVTVPSGGAPLGANVVITFESGTLQCRLGSEVV